jgi:hypothetical protein
MLLESVSFIPLEAFEQALGADGFLLCGLQYYKQFLQLEWDGVFVFEFLGVVHIRIHILPEFRCHE